MESAKMENVFVKKDSKELIVLKKNVRRIVLMGGTVSKMNVYASKDLKENSAKMKNV
jgi:hypothetical protein